MTNKTSSSILAYMVRTDTTAEDAIELFQGLHKDNPLDPVEMTELRVKCLDWIETGVEELSLDDTDALETNQRIGKAVALLREIA